MAKAKPADGSLVSASGSFALNAKNNYVHVLDKFVALVGVSNLVIVETEDALLITTPVSYTHLADEIGNR